jgi:hypothetical protein
MALYYAYLMTNNGANNSAYLMTNNGANNGANTNAYLMTNMALICLLTHI